MSWLKLDDGYDTHPKLLALTELQRWRWTRLLLACARHRRDLVTLDMLRELGLHTAVDKLVRARLLEETRHDVWRVHGYTSYNGGTLDARIKAYLHDHPQASGNEVCRVVGGRRTQVLSAVERYRGGSAEPVQAVDDAAQSRFPEPSGVVPLLARTRAVPSRPVRTSVSQSVVHDDERAPDERGTDGLTALGSTFTDTIDELRRSEDE